MGVTDKQLLDFLRYTGDNRLQEAIDWIGDAMEPEDVFSKESLESWARSTFTVPEDLFPVEDLEQWAINNGWTNQEVTA